MCTSIRILFVFFGGRGNIEIKGGAHTLRRRTLQRARSLNGFGPPAAMICFGLNVQTRPSVSLLKYTVYVKGDASAPASSPPLISLKSLLLLLLLLLSSSSRSNPDPPSSLSSTLLPPNRLPNRTSGRNVKGVADAEGVVMVAGTSVGVLVAAVIELGWLGVLVADLVVGSVVTFLIGTSGRSVGSVGWPILTVVVGRVACVGKSTAVLSTASPAWLLLPPRPSPAVASSSSAKSSSSPPLPSLPLPSILLNLFWSLLLLLVAMNCCSLVVVSMGPLQVDKSN